jgi:hypothetical protein
VSKITNFNSGLQDLRGQASGAAVLALAHNHQQLQEIMFLARAAGVQLTLPALTAGTPDTFVIAPIASQTNTITLVANAVGPAAGITTVEIKDSAGALAVTLTAGALQISLSTTDANNTLTLIKAAIDAAMTSTTGAVASCFITGTASTQMVHGGTNTRAASAAGVTAGTGMKSSTAGTVASRTLAIATIS